MNKYNVLCPSVEEYAKANANPSYCPIETKVGEIEAHTKTEAMSLLSACEADKTFPLGSMLQEKVRHGFFLVHASTHKDPLTGMERKTIPRLFSTLPAATEFCRRLCTEICGYGGVQLVVPDEFLQMNKSILISFEWNWKDEVLELVNKEEI